MSVHRTTTTIEMTVEIEFEYDPGEPGNVAGSPDSWRESFPETATVHAAYHNGVRVALSDDDLAVLEDEALEHIATLREEGAECAAQDRAERKVVAHPEDMEIYRSMPLADWILYQCERIRDREIDTNTPAPDDAPRHWSVRVGNQGADDE